MFKDYRVVIFENDSVDGTKGILSAWQASNSEKVHCIMQDTDHSRTIPKKGEVPGNPFFSERRILKMATYRNRYLDYIEQNGWKPDYLIVVDLDVETLFADAILSSFKNDIGWDAVTALGYSTSPQLRRRYHDTYIFQEWEHRGEPQTEEYMNAMSKKYSRLKPGDPWVRVASAFGGLAIYRYEAVKGLRYQVLPNKDDSVTVYGEHYSLYTQMMDRGYDKFYLNPSMYLKYQRVTPRIIFNSIKRKLLYFCR